MPIAKNSTSSPYPTPCSAVLIWTISVQMSPPLKPSGEVVSSVQISASLPFQPSSAFSSVRMIQLLLIENHLHASTGNASHGETQFLRFLLSLFYCFAGLSEKQARLTVKVRMPRHRKRLPL
jgi:hypothetical protein